MSWRHGALFCALLLLGGCGGDRPAASEKHFGLVPIAPTSNYRVVQRAEGTSSGFWLLFIPIYLPSYAAAEADLYRELGVPYGGKNIANVVEDTSIFSIGLFTIPTKHVRADVVEFEPINPQAQKTATPSSGGSALPANCAMMGNQVLCDQPDK
ncbi:MAG TPA: hypothetical protein VJO12_03585 [Stellaceae bacterium]|nr:hypothetical protein [Stellaceae bacterium]